jgi:Tol biopolymer transport system component
MRHIRYCLGQYRFGVLLAMLGAATALAQQRGPATNAPPRATERAEAAAAEPAAAAAAVQQNYALAVASFAPLNADVFIADADGRNARPFLPDRALDYNASFSADGRWVVFTSTRGGSADIYRARADGTKLEKLTDSPAFDDQGALSPDGDWLAFVSSRSGQADIWTLELKSGDLRNVTSSAGGDFRPQWSPDGQWLAFSSDRGSTNPKFTFATLHSTELYVVRADGSGLKRVTQAGEFAGSPQWSEDGLSLLYYEADVDEVQKIRSPLRLRATTQIASVDVASGERRTLTVGAGEKWSPHRMPNGRIGYSSGGPDGGLDFLTTAATPGGVDEARIGAPGARGEFRSPSWSPDGREMVFHRDVESTAWPPVRSWPSLDPQFTLVRTGVFASHDASGGRLVVNDQKAASLRNSVVLFTADGSGRKVLFGHPERNALAPAFSPAGDRIAFGVGQFFQAAQGMATADIAVISAEGGGERGGEPERLTRGGGNFGFPSWSPDGTRIVYRAAAAERNGLYIVDVATRRVTTLMEGTTHVNFPKWSPRGDRIAFTADIDGDYEIYTIAPDGTGLKRVTNRLGNDAHNAWSPDGEWLAFTSEAGGFKDESPIHPHNPQAYGDIFVIRADGTDLRMLTDDQFEDGTPSFIPTAR